MRRRATKQQIAVAIGILMAVAAAGFWWWPHIQWAYIISRNDIKVQAVAVKELKASGSIDGWASCRIGPLSFQLPSELAENAQRDLGKSAGTVTLTDGDLQLTFFVPVQMSADQKTSLMAFADEMHMSLLKMIVASYRSSTDDFRWTMSRDELRSHQRLLSLSQPQFFPHERGVTVETAFEGPQEAVLIVSNAESAMYQWATPAAKGYVSFVLPKGKLDLDMVRNVCQSMVCDDSQLSRPYSRQDLQQLLDSMEVKVP
jgi:hypothetical protein